LWHNPGILLTVFSKTADSYDPWYSCHELGTALEYKNTELPIVFIWFWGIRNWYGSVWEYTSAG
jgi:hypothetical protein